MRIAILQRVRINDDDDDESGTRKWIASPTTEPLHHHATKHVNVHVNICVRMCTIGLLCIVFRSICSCNICCISSLASRCSTADILNC